MKKKIKSIDGYWYKLPNLGMVHVCCKCGQKHIVKFKIKLKDLELYTNWKRIGK